MKIRKLQTTFIVSLLMLSVSSFGQKNYGSTLNLGAGVGGYYGYYNYVGRSFPFIHADYEIDVAKNFTLAPLINLYSYSNTYKWGTPKKSYTYHESAIQIGGKAMYYLDELLKADPDWDFYLAGSLGFTFVKQVWDEGYGGSTNIYSRSSPLYLDFHAGAEYHINKKVGLFLDLSTSVNTFGVAIHK